MFELFSARAMRAFPLGQQEALDAHHDHVGTEHLLLGLLHLEREEGAPLLGDGAPVAELDAVRAEVLRRDPPKPGPSYGHVPFTDRVKDALTEVTDAARAVEPGQVQPAELLAALLSEPVSIAEEVLAALGVDVRDLERRAQAAAQQADRDN